MSDEIEHRKVLDMLKKHGVNVEEQEKKAEVTAKMLKKLDGVLVIASKHSCIDISNLGDT